MLRAAGSNVSSSVQRNRPARKVTSHCDTVWFSDTSVTATLRTAALSSGYRSKSASVSYTSLAVLPGTCSRRRTVRIRISLRKQLRQQRKSGGQGHDAGDVLGCRRQGASQPVEVGRVEDRWRCQPQHVAGVE